MALKIAQVLRGNNDVCEPGTSLISAVPSERWASVYECLV